MDREQRIKQIVDEAIEKIRAIAAEKDEAIAADHAGLTQYSFGQLFVILFNKWFKTRRYAVNELQKAQAEIQAAEQHLNAAKARLEELSKQTIERGAGEWVPKHGENYFYIDSDGKINCSTNTKHELDDDRIKRGNAFPTEAIAEAATAHVDWWREFDMTDEGGDIAVWTYAFNTGRVTIDKTGAIDSTPRYKTEANARTAIERLGGEQKVIEMLNAGRVFRFKWGGQ